MREYKSQKELYEGLIPAMNVKLALLKKGQYENIACEDIWNYLRDTKWKNSVDLTLGEMVNDIIHTDNMEIVRYVMDKRGNVEGNDD